MPHRVRDNLGIFILKTPTPRRNQPTLLGDCEPPTFTIKNLEKLLGEKPNIFEEPIGE